jgi:hypothetical protein
MRESSGQPLSGNGPHILGKKLAHLWDPPPTPGLSGMSTEVQLDTSQSQRFLEVVEGRSNIVAR